MKRGIDADVRFAGPPSRSNGTPVTMTESPDSVPMAELFRRLATRQSAAFGEIAMRLWHTLQRTARRRLEKSPTSTASATRKTLPRAA
jgi:hypothetical protein